MKGLLFFVILLGIGIVLWMTSQKDGFQDLQVPSAYEDTTPSGASPSLNVPVVTPKQQSFTGGSVQPFAPPSTALLAPPPGQGASVNTKPVEDPALQKASLGRIQSVYESMNGFFQNAEDGLQKLGDPSIQLPLTTARGDRGRLKDELAVLVRNPGLESTLTEEGLSGIEANLAYLQRKWNMSVNSESGAPPEGFESGSGRWSIFGWLFGEEEGFQSGSQYSCPTTLTPNKSYYLLVETKCVEQCPNGYIKTAPSAGLPFGTCKSSSGSEFIPDVINATPPPGTGTTTGATDTRGGTGTTGTTGTAGTTGTTGMTGTMTGATGTMAGTTGTMTGTMTGTTGTMTGTTGTMTGTSSPLIVAATNAAIAAGASKSVADIIAAAGNVPGASSESVVAAAVAAGASTSVANAAVTAAMAVITSPTPPPSMAGDTAKAPTDLSGSVSRSTTSEPPALNKANMDMAGRAQPSPPTNAKAPTTTDPKAPTTTESRATTTSTSKAAVAGTNSDVTLSDIGTLITKIDIEMLRLGKFTGDY